MVRTLMPLMISEASRPQGSQSYKTLIDFLDKPILYLGQIEFLIVDL